MTREELKAHCKKQIEQFEFWARGDDEKLNNSKLYQEHKLILELLEQGEVLDEIKRDIFNACSDNYHMPVYKLDCDKIFEIIDKYKAEQETSNER